MLTLSTNFKKIKKPKVLDNFEKPDHKYPTQFFEANFKKKNFFFD